MKRTPRKQLSREPSTITPRQLGWITHGLIDEYTAAHARAGAPLPVFAYLETEELSAYQAQLLIGGMQNVIAEMNHRAEHGLVDEATVAYWQRKDRKLT